MSNNVVTKGRIGSRESVWINACVRGRNPGTIVTALERQRNLHNSWWRANTWWWEKWALFTSTRSTKGPRTDQQVFCSLSKCFNSLPPKSLLAGATLVLFGRYVLNFYVGIVQWILCETKTWCTTIYLTTQHTNWWILTSAKKIKFWPSTHVVDAASFIKIRSNSGQAEVITRSMRYQTLWTDKYSARNYSTTKHVKKVVAREQPSGKLLNVWTTSKFTIILKIDY